MGKSEAAISDRETVPALLRKLFVFHFAVDYLFAIPLMFAPQYSLELLGWSRVDPVATRLVAAALLGIGGVSFLARRADAATYRHMLTMKLLWSSAAAFGLALSVIEGAPRFAGVVLAIFLIFFVVWLCYRIRLIPARNR